jgi:hypothetical protein
VPGTEEASSNDDEPKDISGQHVPEMQGALLQLMMNQNKILVVVYLKKRNNSSTDAESEGPYMYDLLDDSLVYDDHQIDRHGIILGLELEAYK